MVCCLNPNCQNPVNPDATEFRLSCKTKLLPLLSNRYRAICPLSSGVSQRFLAKDREKPNQTCVIKQFIPPIKDNSAYQKTKQLFQAEAQRLQQIGEHPQIPTLYAYFEQDCNRYLVHQSIAGQTLRQELEQEGIFSEHKIWDLLSELLPLLYFVHKHQVIHRHINPDNIIRRQSDGKLMLINFPIAEQLSHFDIDAAQTTSHLFGDIPLEKINNPN